MRDFTSVGSLEAEGSWDVSAVINISEHFIQTPLGTDGKIEVPGQKLMGVDQGWNPSVPDYQTHEPYGHIPFNSTSVGHICWCRGGYDRGSEAALGDQKRPILLEVWPEEPRHKPGPARPLLWTLPAPQLQEGALHITVVQGAPCTVDLKRERRREKKGDPCPCERWRA